MATDGAFLVEDFVNAITTQLDRVQDALRIKALNRPLTYALKDLSLELKVFVDMDARGNVRFRASGPNEAGASSVQLSFTTITKPMIEENTISLAATRSASLTELGLKPEEQQQLERLGVRNLAQLNNLQANTGVTAISRLTEVPPERLRQALLRGRPRIQRISPQPPRPQPSAPPRSAPPVRPRPEAPPRPTLPSRPSKLLTTPKLMAVEAAPVVRAPQAPVLRVPSGTRRLDVLGLNLLAEGDVPEVNLGHHSLTVREADQDRLVIDLPEDRPEGTLTLSLPGGEVVAYQLAVDGAGEAFEADDDRLAPADGLESELPSPGPAEDAWAPTGGHR
jgi:hypothetical protein